MAEQLTAWPKEQTLALSIPLSLVDIRGAENRVPGTEEVRSVLARYPRVLLRRGVKGPGEFRLLAGDWLLNLRPDQKQTQPDRMCLISFLPAYARTKREFLQASVCLWVKGGWVVTDTTGSQEGYTPARARVFAAFLEQLEAALDRVDARTSAAAARNESDPEAERLLDTLAAYADMEHELEREAVLGRKPYVYLQVEPVAAPRISRTAYRFVLESPPDDDDNLKEGDSLEVTRQDGGAVSGKDGTPLRGSVTAVTPTSVTVAFLQQFNFRDLPQPGLLKPGLNDVQHEVRLETLDRLRRGTARSKYLLPVVAHGRYARPLITARAVTRSNSLNPAQRAAVDKGVRATDLLLVQGPPGTGKTTVIAEWVYHFVGLDRRVLISSKNNAAVDNVLERLIDERRQPADAPRLRVIRVGNEDRVAESVREVLLDNQAGFLQREMLARSRQALGPFLQALPLVEEYERLLREYAAALESLRSRRDAMYASQDEILRRWGPQLKSVHDRLRAVQEEGLRLVRRGARWRRVRELAASVSQRNRFLAWLAAAPMAVARWWLGRLEQRVGQALQLESELVGRYEETWENLEREWHGPAMLALKGACREAEERSNRLAREAADRGEEAARATESLPSFRLPPPPLDGDPASVEAARQQVAPVLQRLRAVTEAAGDWQRALESGRRQVLYSFLLRVVDVVGATCIGINSDRRFSELDFDVTIVDEAGQIQATDVVVPLSRAPKGIMVGDHKQLPPVVDPALLARAEEAGVETELLSKSLFEILYENAPDSNRVFLDTQYRMPAELADFISKQFYQGVYKSPDSKRGLRPLLPFCRAPLCLVDTAGEPRRRERALRPGYENAFEARLVAEIVAAACRAGIDVADLGVITPYAHQAALIYRLLTRDFGLPDETGALRDNIATVDSFQGQERELIVYTFTRSNPSGRVGFLKELRRLNVALTRPRAQLVLVGDFGTLCRAEDPSFAQTVSVLAETVKRQGDYTTASEMRERLNRGRR